MLQGCVRVRRAGIIYPYGESVMNEISAALVKELRDETNVGMMECKRALIEAGGDKSRAIQILRERGLAVATKKRPTTA